MNIEDIIKERLNYNPITGHLTWQNCRTWGRTVNGAIAGSLDTHGYIRIRLTYDGKQYAYWAHRVAWFLKTGAWPKHQVDHRNGCRNENWWSNLREATPTINCKNTRKLDTNTSGNTGIDFMPQRNKWRARICSQHLGLFNTKQEAITARHQAEIEDGDFTARHGTKE